MNAKNRKTRFAILLAVLLSLPVVVHPQDKNSKPNEYQSLIESARTKVESQPHTRTSIQQIFDEGKNEPSETRTSISEVIPPDREHIVFEHRADATSSKSERIRIGNVEYRRVNGGLWEKRERADPGSGSGSGSSSFEYRHLGKKELNGLKLDVFERVSRSKIIRNGIPKVSVYRTQYYVGADGLLRKEISDSDNLITKRAHTEISYETASTLTIDAPIP